MASRLPVSLTEWRTVLHQALQLPKAAVRVPKHFIVRAASPTQPAIRFGLDRVAADAPKRFSGILLLLMPAATSTSAAHVTTTEGEAVLAAPPAASSSSSSVVTPPPFFDLCLPVTRRQSKMRAHSGEMALPGGRCDGGETPVQAAQREALEEIGVPAFAYDVLGETSRVYSYPSKSFVEPVVALSRENLASCVHVASPDEVASIHYLTMSELLLNTGGTCHKEIVKSFSGASELGKVIMPAFDTRDGQRVWGLTAFVLSELVARVATVLGVTIPYESEFVPRVAELPPALTYHNPYDEASRQPTYGDAVRGGDAAAGKTDDAVAAGGVVTSAPPSKL